MNVAIAAMIAGRLRSRRRDHAVTRIHDNHTIVHTPYYPTKLQETQETQSPIGGGIHLTCIALEGAEGIGGAMALEVVPAAAGRLHSDQYSKIL